MELGAVAAVDLAEPQLHRLADRRHVDVGRHGAAQVQDVAPVAEGLVEALEQPVHVVGRAGGLRREPEPDGGEAEPLLAGVDHLDELVGQQPDGARPGGRRQREAVDRRPAPGVALGVDHRGEHGVAHLARDLGDERLEPGAALGVERARPQVGVGVERLEQRRREDGHRARSCAGPPRASRQLYPVAPGSAHPRAALAQNPLSSAA
ncbi:MAG: hypothetical protein R3F59_22580 [Myxococcota bacterium]